MTSHKEGGGRFKRPSPKCDSTTRRQHYRGTSRIQEFELQTLQLAAQRFFIDFRGLYLPSRKDPPRNPPCPEEIDLARAWLRKMVSPIKTCGISSYKAKHIAERWAGRYVSNGAMILAAYLERYPQVPFWFDSLNTKIGISKRACRLAAGVVREVSQ